MGITFSLVEIGGKCNFVGRNYICVGGNCIFVGGKLSLGIGGICIFVGRNYIFVVGIDANLHLWVIYDISYL